jgi:hypothetical protein
MHWSLVICGLEEICGDDVPASVEPLKMLADAAVAEGADAIEEEDLPGETEILKDHHFVAPSNRGGRVEMDDDDALCTLLQLSKS